MFSKNEKISEKQIGRILTLSTFSGCILVLPFMSARLFGNSVMTGLLCFFFWTVLYCALLFMIGNKRVNRKECREIQDKKLWLWIQLFRQVIRVTFFVVLSVTILGEAQVPFMQDAGTDNPWNFLVALPLFVVAIYGAGKRLEVFARINEMIFPAIFIPFVVMILFGLYEVDYEIFVPGIYMPWWRLLAFSYVLLTFTVPVEQYIFLRPYLAENPITTNGERSMGSDKKLFLKTISCVALCVIIALLILGIYGVNGGGKDSMVTVSIMRYIRLPLGILERFDVLMVWFFVMGCFVLLCGHLFYGGCLLVKLGVRKKMIWLWGVLLLTLILAWILPDYENLVFWYLLYGAFVDVPLSILIPVWGKGGTQA